MAWRTFASSNDGLVAGLLKEQVCSVWTAEKMRLVDRAWFVKVQPYTDAPQMLGYGQTISAPHMHAYALDILRHVLDRKDDAKINVLDVGAGWLFCFVCFECFPCLSLLEHKTELKKLWSLFLSLFSCVFA